MTYSPEPTEFSVGTHPRRRLLVIDAAYTYRIMRERGIEILATMRDLDGYFEHVWTVHPMASVLDPPGSPGRLGPPITHDLARRHTMIEGKAGRFNWPGWLFPLNFLIGQVALFCQLARLVRDEEIDVIRAEDPRYMGLFGWALARWMRRPAAACIWGPPDQARAQSGGPIMPRLFPWVWLEEAVERFVLRHVDIVLMNDEQERAFALAAGVPRAQTKLFRIGNALDPSHFVDPAERHSALPELERLGVAGETIALSIARLEKIKLVEDVVRTIAVLAGRDRRVVALMIGDGSCRDELAQLAAELGVADRIVFCGNRSQEWIAKIVPAAALVLSPYTGRALGEAALGGAPIVAYDTEWHRVFVEPEVTGELVPLGEVEGMAAAAERLLDDPARARRMAIAVRAKALEVCDRRKLNAIQIATYEALLDSRPRPAAR